jgi:uncharacterized protein (TIGR03437 family)
MRLPLFAIALAAVSFLPAQTGAPVPVLAGLDQAMTSYLAKAKTNGGALAVTQGGRLVYARGFGLADTTLKTPVQPDSLFRVGSISKPITSMTALRLVQDGRLALDAPIVPLLGATVLPAGAIADARWNQITVRHLMQHSGGWDADASFDPLVSYAVIEGLGLTLPLRQALTVDDVIRFMAKQPLQFAPGTRYTYSNFGMLLLGRVIERVSGVPYEKLVRDTVLEPMGIQRMALGGALPAQRRLGEVEYYDALRLPAVYPGIGAEVPAPDGGYYFEIIQGAGAWIASPIDLVRFADGVDGRKGPALLRPETIRQMTARPPFTATGDYYGLGWVLEQNGPSLDWSHNGAIEGTFALLYRSELAGGVSFALTFNGLPQSDTAPDELIGAIAATLLSVRQWPTGDAFETLLPATAPRLSGVVSAATQMTGVSPGGLVSLYGLNLGPLEALGTRLEASGRVAASLGGVEVLFDGLPAPLLYVARNQINAVAPMALKGRAQARVEVVRNGQRSAVFVAPVLDTAPGVFTLSGNGRALAVALNSDGSLNGEQTPATRGSVVTLWGTGFENFATALRDGEVPRGANALRTPPRVRIGEQAADVLYAGAAPGFVAGVLQYNVRVPANASAGRAFVEITSADGASRQEVWLWVR